MSEPASLSLLGHGICVWCLIVANIGGAQLEWHHQRHHRKRLFFQTTHMQMGHHWKQFSATWFTNVSSAPTLLQLEHIVWCLTSKHTWNTFWAQRRAMVTQCTPNNQQQHTQHNRHCEKRKTQRSATATTAWTEEDFRFVVDILVCLRACGLNWFY